jgi:hypothetical protein
MPRDCLKILSVVMGSRLKDGRRRYKDVHRPTLNSRLGQRDRVSRVYCTYSPRKTSCLPIHPTPRHDDTHAMSSLLDLALNSDAAPTPASDAGSLRRSQQIRSSSARPRGPPSESAGANSDVEGDPDDEIVGARVPGRRTNAPRTDIPKVVDVTGETLSLRFQEFLEK